MPSAADNNTILPVVYSVELEWYHSRQSQQGGIVAYLDPVPVCNCKPHSF